jgi:pimeloyl-ACP methyl ester carboxylesterase
MLVWVLLSIAIAALAQVKVPNLGPAPGTRIDIGGHKLHIHCVGPDAKPVVILEAGGGAFSKDWSTVQSLLAARIRTCAYDRAGLGWSDPGPAPRTLAQEVFELNLLLESAKVSGPFVLVGQSLGALNVRLYTQKYGNEVAGVVLIDPADESSILFNVTANRWMKLRDQASGRAVPAPRRTGPTSTGYTREDDYLGDEAQLLYLHRKENLEPFGDRPLFMLAAGKRPLPPGATEGTYKDIRRANDQVRAEAAHMSRNSKFLVDPDSGHNIQIDDPKAVAEAVQEVVVAVNNHTKLARVSLRRFLMPVARTVLHPVRPRHSGIAYSCVLLQALDQLDTRSKRAFRTAPRRPSSQ